MAGVVYVKFRAQLSWDPVSFDGHFISVGELKRLVCEKKSLGDAIAELVLSDPSGSEYAEDSTQIPKGSRVLLRRVPQNRARVLVGSTPLPAMQALQPAAPAAATTGGPAAGGGMASTSGPGDDFGADPFAQNAASLQQEQAAARNLALVAAAAPGPSKAVGGGWGMGGGRGGAAGGRAGGGRGRGPAGTYICRRCGEAGKHWEKDCPTVGDPTYDYKTVRMPTGIPVTKLQRNADGSLYLPTGELGELAANTSAFQKQLALMTGAAAQEQQAADDSQAAAAAAASAPLLLMPAPAPAGGEVAQQAAAPEAARPSAAREPTPPVQLPEQQKQPVEQPQQQEQQEQKHQEQKQQEQQESAVPQQQQEQLKQEPLPAAEPDLFGDDELDHAATPIPISLTDATPPPPTPPHTNGTLAKEDSEVDAAQLWASYHALHDVLPPGTTLKLWVEAFGAGRPLTREEYAHFQEEHKAAAAKLVSKPARASVEREQPSTMLSRSWSRNEAVEEQRPARLSSRPSERESRPSERERNRRSRSRSRSRSWSRERNGRRGAPRRSRSNERSPSVRRRQPSASPPARSPPVRRRQPSASPPARSPPVRRRQPSASPPARRRQPSASPPARSSPVRRRHPSTSPPARSVKQEGQLRHGTQVHDRSKRHSDSDGARRRARSRTAEDSRVASVEKGDEYAETTGRKRLRDKSPPGSRDLDRWLRMEGVHAGVQLSHAHGCMASVCLLACLCVHVCPCLPACMLCSICLLHVHCICMVAWHRHQDWLGLDCKVPRDNTAGVNTPVCDCSNRTHKHVCSIPHLSHKVVTEALFARIVRFVC